LAFNNQFTPAWTAPGSGYALKGPHPHPLPERRPRAPGRWAEHPHTQTVLHECAMEPNTGHVRMQT